MTPQPALFAQLEDAREAPVLAALGRLEGAALGSELTLLLGLVRERWKERHTSQAVRTDAGAPHLPLAPSEQVAGRIMRLLERALPQPGLPETLAELLELCTIFSRHIHPSTYTHGEHRLSEVEAGALERYRRHEAVFERVLPLAAVTRQEFVLFAQILHSHWRSPQAGPFLERAVTLEPDQPLHYHRWRALHGPQPGPHNSFTVYYLAEFRRYAAHDLERALEGFRHFLRLEPAFLPDANFEPDDAYLESANLPPSSVQAWAEVGHILRAQGQPQAAEAAYARATLLELHSQQAPYRALAQVLESQGRDPEAAYQALLAPGPSAGRAVSSDLRTRLALCDWLGRTARGLWAEQRKEALHRCKQALEQLGPLLAQLQGLGDVGPRGVQMRYGWTRMVSSEADPAQQVRRWVQPCREREFPALLERLRERLLGLRLLQANIVLEGYHDYWQARSLYQTLLPHPEAKTALEHIRAKLGY